MRFLLSGAVTALATSAFAGPVPLQKRGAACTNGAVVFAVRGSDYGHSGLTTDPYYADIGPSMTNIANAIISKAGGGSLNPIPYPAIVGSQYQDSVNIGITNLQNAIYDYIDRCSNGKVFVLGYSQGGQVVTGALAGSKAAGPLNGHMRITGGAAFADVSFHDGFFPVDAGSGANNGVNGNTSGDGTKYNFLNTNFGPRFRSYCQAGDKWCDKSAGVDEATASEIHKTAVYTFRNDATAFLTGLL